MGLDGTALLLIGIFFIRGYLKGLIVAAFSVVAILLGLLVALKCSQTLATWLLLQGYASAAWVQPISYLLLFIGVVVVVRMLARLVEQAAEGLMLGFVNKLAGGVLYAFLGAVLWSSLLWIGAQSGIITKEQIDASKSYSLLSGLAPWFFDVAGALLPFVKDTFTKLEHLFDSVNHPPANVDTP